MDSKNSSVKGFIGFGRGCRKAELFYYIRKALADFDGGALKVFGGTGFRAAGQAQKKMARPAHPTQKLMRKASCIVRL